MKKFLVVMATMLASAFWAQNVDAVSGDFFLPTLHLENTTINFDAMNLNKDINFSLINLSSSNSKFDYKVTVAPTEMIDAHDATNKFNVGFKYNNNSGNINLSEVSPESLKGSITATVPAVTRASSFLGRTTVSFEANNISHLLIKDYNYDGLVHSEYVKEGFDLSTIEDPAPRKGYTFKGWFTEKTNGVEIAGKLEKATTVYAQWERIPGVYAKLYDTNSDGIGETLVLGKYTDFTYTGTLIDDYDLQDNTSLGANRVWKNDVSKITTVDFVDEVTPTTTNSWFAGATILNDINHIEELNTNNVTDMSYMFRKCKALTSIDLSHFNTSKVTSMNYMFNNCQHLTELDLTTFSSESLLSVTGMFSDWDAEKDGWADIPMVLQHITFGENFTTYRVTNMSGLFDGLKNLKVVDISMFHSNSLTKAFHFANWSNLETVYVNKEFKYTNELADDGIFLATKLVGGNGTKYTDIQSICQVPNSCKEYFQADIPGQAGLFTLKPALYNLSIKSVNSHGTVNSELSGPRMSQANYTVTASPSPGYKFLGWSNGKDIVSTDTSYTFEMPDSDYTLTALFTLSSVNNGEVIPYNENITFIVIKDLKSWTDAEAYAQSLGGHLAKLDTKDKNDLIISKISSIEQFWFGMSDAAVEGTWKWTWDNTIAGYVTCTKNANGQCTSNIQFSGWKYQIWNSGEPNNAWYGNGIKEDYGLMLLKGKWNDGRSPSQFGFIVEIHTME